MARSLAGDSDVSGCEGGNRRASRSSTRAGSTVPSGSAANPAAVVKILSKKELAGIGTMYTCELENGRKKSINYDQLKQDYPDLVEAYSDSSSDSDAEVVTRLRPNSRPARPSASSALDKPNPSTKFYANQSTKTSTRSSTPLAGPARPSRAGKQMRVVVLDDDSDARTDNGTDDDQMDVDDDDDNSRSQQSSSVQTQKTTTEEEQSDSDSPEQRRTSRGATLRKRGATHTSARRGTKRSAPAPTRRSGRNSNANQVLTVDSGSDNESDSELELDPPTPPRRRGRPRKNPAPSSGDDIDMLAPKTRSRGRRAVEGKGKGRARDDESSEDESAVEDQEEEESQDDSEELEVEWAGSTRPQHLHTDNCVRCGRLPTPALLKKFAAGKKRPNAKRRADRDVLLNDTDDEFDNLEALGAWFNCGTCIESYHFGCLGDDARKLVRDKFKAEYEAAHPLPLDAEGNPIRRLPGVADPRPKIELDVEAEYTIPKCPACVKPNARRCFVCGVVGRKTEVDRDGDVAVVEADAEETKRTRGPKPGLMFRCNTCRRGVHYECCAPDTDDETVEARAESYKRAGVCHDCWNWQTPLEGILAWAPDDALDKGSDNNVDGLGDTAIDKEGKKFTIPSAKDPTAPAEYLVKWKDMSFRRTDWVPHAFLAAKFPAKLANFLAYGPRINLDPPPEGNELEDDEIPSADDAGKPAKARMMSGEPPRPDPEAELRIPIAWRTVDRVLDVGFRTKKAGQPKFYLDIPRRILDADPEETIDEVEEIDVKWGDLPYSEWTREAPPARGDQGYEAFERAYAQWIAANQDEMRVPDLSRKDMEILNKPKAERLFEAKLALTEQPDFLSGGKLMDFQLGGVNRMLHSWWMKKGMILADEMGLGKTVQVIAFLGTLEKTQGARPFLVAVPNSTIPNWMREFEKWAPGIRVVSYSGGRADRDVIEQKEMFTRKGELKTHVVVATYESLEKNAAVFRRVARWDTLVVDEGQRLKGGKSGLLFKALATLNIGHRVILSGTPIQNNVLELFNLLHFLNPEDVPDPEQLAIDNQELDAEKVETIRGMLQPRMLRRTKELVLDLPQLVEIVIPCTVTQVQREMYQAVLKREVESIGSLVAASAGMKNGKTPSKKGYSSMINILMELRKCLGHPYLNHPEMYRADLSEADTHRHLTEASTKLVLLEKLLPKLQARGHRVLLFSQFKLTLNLIEDFLNGMGIKYLRLDGDTSTLNRQRGIDAYNAPDSEYLVYLLSTRAGGVGINLTSADTVIIYDQDFNPQQDIQAIARAHRIGQTKPVRVFKLMVKGTCEEKILQACNKKLGLDHLIIKRMDESDPTEDVQSILQYGAQAIFDDEEAKKQEIKYTDKDIDDLIDRSSAVVNKDASEGAGATFAQAQIWRREEGALAEVSVDDLAKEDGGDQHDFWARILAEKKEQDERARLDKLNSVGRGKRQRRQDIDYTDTAKPKKQLSSAAPSSDAVMMMDDSEDEFAPNRLELSGEESSEGMGPPVEPEPKLEAKAKLAKTAVDQSVAGAKARWDPKTEKKLFNQRILAIETLLPHARVLNLPKVVHGLEAAKTLPRDQQLAFLRTAVQFIEDELEQCEIVDDVPEADPGHHNGRSSTTETNSNHANGSANAHPAAIQAAAQPPYVPATFAIPGLVPARSESTPAAAPSGPAQTATAPLVNGVPAANGSSTPPLASAAPVSAAGAAALSPALPTAVTSTPNAQLARSTSASRMNGASASPAKVANGFGSPNIGTTHGTPVRAVANGSPAKAAATPGSAGRAKATPSSVVSKDGKVVELLTLDDSDDE